MDGTSIDLYIQKCDRIRKNFTGIQSSQPIIKNNKKNKGGKKCQVFVKDYLMKK